MENGKLLIIIQHYSILFKKTKNSIKKVAIELNQEIVDKKKIKKSKLKIMIKLK